MPISDLQPTQEILLELGRRLAMVRNQKGLLQSDLAEASGIGVATLGRMESGRDSQMETWLKVLRALDMTASIDLLLPETFRSPIADAKTTKKKLSKQQKQKDAGFRWGDDAR